MLIDWFTVIAQVINFLILVLLLKRFLYQPVLKAIEAREQKIRSQLQEAEDHMEAAKEEKSKFEKKNRELEKERDHLMDEAREQADKQRRLLLEEARKEARELQTQLEKMIQEEQQEFHHDLKERVKREVFAIAQKTLKDLASENLENNIIRVFIQRLDNLPEEEKEKLQNNLRDQTDGLLIKSAFSLNDKQKDHLEQKITALTGHPVPLQFEVVSEKIGGIELHAQGFKLAWSIADYLDSLEKTLDQVLNQPLPAKYNVENEVTEKE